MNATSKLVIEAALMATTEARVQRALAVLIEQEAKYHAFLEALAEESARHQGRRRGARILRNLGQRHVEQREMGLQEIWAHRQLEAASRSAAIELVGNPDDLESGHVFSTPSDCADEGKTDYSNDSVVRARRLLLRHAELAKDELVQRMRDVTIARMTLAVMDGNQRRLIEAQGGMDRTQNSASAHASLARNLDTQATLHRELAMLEARRNGTRWVGDTRSWQECRRSVLGPEIWADQQLAARSTARALWHTSCSEFMTAAVLAEERVTG